MHVHLLAQLLGVSQGGSQHAGHLAGQESIQGGAQGQPGVREHAAAGPVMHLQSRTKLSRECRMPNIQHAKRKMTGASQAAKIHQHAPDATGERLHPCHIYDYKARSSFLHSVSHVGHVPHKECLLTQRLCLQLSMLPP